MLARKSRASEEESEINITPMLDVVFIMLIFFIVTATFIKQAGIEVVRPDADTASKKPLVSVLIAISRTDEIWIDKSRVDESAVRAHIERLHAENPKGGIVVQADRLATYAKLKAVLDAVQGAGVTEVAISTNE